MKRHICLHGGGYLNILIVCCTIILNIIIGCPILNCMIHYNVCIMIKANIEQFCGPVEIIVGGWIW